MMDRKACAWAVAALLGLLATALLAPAAQAQSYPNKVITLIVPSSAGGPADVASRLIVDRMSAILGQQIVIETIPGAGGTIGMGRVARAAPDGYTLLIHQTGFVITPALYEKLPFDTEKDFVTVGLVNRSDIHLSGRKSIPATDFPGLLAWLKGPGKPVRFAHPGKGTVGHMQAVVLTAALGIEANLIPYRGIAPAVNDLVGGHIDLALVASAVATPQVKSGNLKVFATTSPKREAAFPDVPTFGELGYKMMERPFWHALFAPAGTPPAILQKLNAALRQTLADPKVRKAYAETGVEAFPDAQSSVEAAQAYVRDEMGFWGKAVRDNNVKVD